MLDEGQQRTAIEADDWVLGRHDALVTMLEYGDFECPYCALARPVLESLVLENPNLVKLVYRHFPIVQLHPHAMTAAEAAEAAGARGRFWEMHDLLFTNQQALLFDDLLSYASAIQLPLDDFASDLRRHVHLEEVRRDYRRGVVDGVNGTPTIFIDGERYDGPRDRDAMAIAIEAIARTKAPYVGEQPDIGP
jgi:protein-disulfide isomerase